MAAPTVPTELLSAVAARWAEVYERPLVARLARAVGVPARLDDRKPAAADLARRALRVVAAGDAAERLATLPAAARELWRTALGRAGDLLADDGRALLDAAAALLPPPGAAELAAEPPPGDRPRVPVLAGSSRWTGEEAIVAGPLCVQAREVAAQVEITRALREAAAEKLWLPAGWKNAPRRTRERFARLLEGPDFTRAGLRARIWPILVSLGDLSTPVSVACVAASPAARALAAAPPRVALRALLRAWLEHPEYDDLESVERLADGTPPPVACVLRFADRRVRRHLLAAAARCLPVGAWVPVAPFVDHLIEHGLLPPVADRLWPPYLSSVAFRPLRSMSFVEVDGEPLRLRVPALLAAFFEVFATLGVLDVAWIPRGAGVVRAAVARSNWLPAPGPHTALTHVRLTELGAWLLDPLADVAPAPRPPADHLDVLADLLSG